MRHIAFDLGKRRTGVAFFDSDVGFVVPLDTVQSTNSEELAKLLLSLTTSRRAGCIVVGLPLLPGGEEGEQAVFVRSIVKDLESKFPVFLIDERYSTDRRSPGAPFISRKNYDPDAASACQILEMYESMISAGTKGKKDI